MLSPKRGHVSTRRAANPNEIESTFAHAVANPPATTAPEFSPRNVKLLEKISAIESDMEELTQRQQHIRESILALRALIKPRSDRKVATNSESQNVIRQPAPNRSDLRQSNLQPTSSPTISGPGRSADELAIEAFFDKYEGSDVFHQKDAAGLVASSLHAREERLLTPNQRRILIDPLEMMLQTEKSAVVWFKVMHWWLDDCQDKRLSEVDDMLDPYILSAVRELLPDESRANGMLGDDEVIEDYLTALGKSSEEVDRRKSLQL
ncbi:MAG: hypothetical protein Q9204_005109 [Flavoplaca sp. TL-2023a]